MTISTYLLFVCLIIASATALAIFYVLREKSLRSVTREWKTVDLRAMTQLFSDEDDEFLAQNLPFAVLFKLRLQRFLAASAYLSRLNQNAACAIALARLQREGESRQLREAALALRMEVLRLYVKIWSGLLVPRSCHVAHLAELNAGLSQRFSAVTIQ
jgi:hypothetical protein